MEEKKKFKYMKAADLTIDYEMYPRALVSESTITRYYYLMLSGHQFPPIKLCRIGKSKKIVILDGIHRFRAWTERLDLKEVPVEEEVLWFPDKVSALKEAIRLNQHGRSLSGYDIRKCAYMLNEYGVSKSEICKLLGLTQIKLESFLSCMSSRFLRPLVQDTLQIIHPKEMSSKQIDQNKFYSRDVSSALRQVIELFREGIIQKHIEANDQKVLSLCQELYELLEENVIVVA